MRLPAVSALGVVALLFVAAVAGCGGSESKQPTAAPREQSGNGLAERHQRKSTGTTNAVPSSEVSAPEKEPGGPLQDVGTFTVSDKEGTAYRNRYKIGPFFYPDEGSPPEEVLETCNLWNRAIVEKSVFARGEISVSYTEGSFPESFGIDAEGIVSGTDIGIEVTAYQIGGKWLCRQEEQVLYEIQPHETWNIPIWFIDEAVLNNAQPQVPPEVSNGWHFGSVGPPMTGTFIFRGPGAGDCYGYEAIYLYNRSGHC